MKALWFLPCLLLAATLSHGQKTIHVPAQYLTIQGGINAAADGDTVLVEEGLYKENIFFLGKKITVASRLLEDGDSSHIVNTVIDGSNASGEEYASVVHFVSGEDTTSVLMGFTLTHGEGYQNRMGGNILVSESGAKIVSNIITCSKLVAWQSKGAGIFAASWDTGSNFWVIIENNAIICDSAYSVQDDGAFGGGIYIESMNARIKSNIIASNLTNGGIHCVGGGIACYGYDKTQTVEIRDNEIYNNRCKGTKNIGGGVFVWNCIAHIIDNHIYKNICEGEEQVLSYASGGGIGIDNVNGGTMISGNVIEKNECKNAQFLGRGGGLQVWYNDTAVESLNPVFIDGNTIRKNKALYGGGVYARSTNISFTNNFFDDNYALDLGGAICLAGLLDESAQVRIMNNTFLSNAAVTQGASIYNAMQTSLVLLNNLFWENLAADEITVGLADMAMYYCNIETDSINGEWVGDFNFREDPQLEKGCILATGSSCVNTGGESVTVFGHTFYAPLHDIRRIPRPQDGYFDVGAYELLFAQEESLTFDGLIRYYRVYFPAAFYRAPSLPVVINLHGEGRDAQYQMDWTGMDAVADTMGFIVAYPEAVNGQWNAFLEDTINDAGFIDAMIDDLHVKYDVDLDRIYACGHSLGGFMSTTLACELSQCITAVATEGGGIGENISGSCDITRHMPVLVIHGTADVVEPYSHAEETVNFWNSHNGCQVFKTEDLPDLDPDDGSTVEKTTYMNGDKSCSVVLYKVINGGHQWPGAEWTEEGEGNRNMDIDAGLEMWQFFSPYKLSDFISAVPEYKEPSLPVKTYPNPFTATVTLEYVLRAPGMVKITIFNHLGEVVFDRQEKNSQGRQTFVWHAGNQTAGIYYYRLQAGESTGSGKLIMMK
jgi:polyhydroxybutyrate depolymerase